MTQQLRAGVLAAPLAAIDRRALSQAWYSALGFAGHREVGRSPGRTVSSARPAEVAPSARRVAGANRTRTLRPPLRVCRAAAGGKRDVPAPEARSERRAAPSALAVAIERRFMRTPFPVRATFGLDGGRVHVILRARGNDVCLIALCAPAARARVARALEEARYALGARGISLGVERISARRQP